jgi:hypothetical protein
VAFQDQRDAPMNTPLQFWAKITLRLAVVLLAIGLMPLLALQFLWPSMDPVVPVLLSVMVAPLGAVCLAVAIILFLVVLVRKERGSS